MKLATNKPSSRKSNRRSTARRRRRTRSYATSVPLVQQLGGLFGGRSVSRKASTRTASGWAGTASRVLAFLLAVSTLGLLVWFFADYRFFVYAAEIGGAETVSAGDVYQAAGLHEMSVFYVNRAKAAEQICGRLLAVESATVSCAVPARVQVAIQEKRVAYRWHIGGQAYLVDEDGLVLGLDDGVHQGAIAIHDGDGDALAAGDMVDANVLRAVREVCAMLPETKVLQYSEAMGVSISLAQGPTVYLGDGRDMPAKLATMRAMLREVSSSGQSVDLIDVRFVGSPYYR